MGEIHRPSALRFLQQDVDELLPHAAALVFAQAPVAGLRRGGDVVGQVFPLTAGLEHGQDAIENFPFVCPGPSRPRAFRRQGAQRVPLAIRKLGPVWLPCDRKNLV